MRPRFSIILAIAGIGCDAEPDDAVIPTFETDVRGALVRCGDERVDLVQMNALLDENPDLAEAIGMERVTCANASEFGARMNDYIESFPSEPLAAADDVEFRIMNAEAQHLTTNGVLELPGDIGCTGVLINSRALLTAAHCVLVFSEGATNFWEDDFLIENFGGGYYFGTVRINIHPDFTQSSPPDTGDDIALVKLTEGTFGFPDEDRHRIYTGAMSTIGSMNLYGQGESSNNGGGEGILRRMRYTPTWAGPEHYFNEAGESRVCFGDSGGPSLDNLPTLGHSVVAGLMSNAEIDDGESCARYGGKQRSVRLQNKVRWIDQMLGGTDTDDCGEFNDSGWVYERCW